MIEHILTFLISHGLTDRQWISYFTEDTPIIFNFHSYPWLIHRLTYKRPGSHHIHVRGYKEKGNIDTPLELAIRNQTDRYSLAMDAIDRLPHLQNKGSMAREKLYEAQIKARNWAYENGIDPEDVRTWKWPYGPKTEGISEGISEGIANKLGFGGENKQQVASVGTSE